MKEVNKLIIRKKNLFCRQNVFLHVLYNTIFYSYHIVDKPFFWKTRILWYFDIGHIIVFGQTINKLTNFLHLFDDRFTDWPALEAKKIFHFNLMLLKINGLFPTLAHGKMYGSPTLIKSLIKFGVECDNFFCKAIANKTNFIKQIFVYHLRLN